MTNEVLQIPRGGGVGKAAPCIAATAPGSGKCWCFGVPRPARGSPASDLRAGGGASPNPPSPLLEEATAVQLRSSCIPCRLTRDTTQLCTTFRGLPPCFHPKPLTPIPLTGTEPLHYYFWGEAGPLTHPSTNKLGRLLHSDGANSDSDSPSCT